jgi:HD-GYP domain-containing protein (c-di-GMP phosphodiesterase class II)
MKNLMVQKVTSYNLIQQVLAKDLYSESGVLLLSKGTELKASDITLLMNHHIYEVGVQMDSPPLSTQIVEQYNGLWTYEDYQLREDYLHSLENVKLLFHKVLNGKISPLDDFMKAFTPVLEKTLRYSYLFHPLHKIKGHDEYTYRHSLNVGLLSGVIGKILGLSSQETFLLGQMGLLHDIGKLKINDEVLSKPGKLSQEEFKHIKLHTYYGFELLKNMEGAHELLYNAALSHHERLDGTGYPEKLMGDDIPFFVQIISVADTYDAICSDRIYKDKASPYYAAQELMEGIHKKKYNPSIVIPFVRYLAEGFVGDQAVLNTGETGDVILIHPEEPDRPTLQIGGKHVDLRTKRDLQIIDLIVS